MQYVYLSVVKYFVIKYIHLSIAMLSIQLQFKIFLAILVYLVKMCLHFIK